MADVVDDKNFRKDPFMDGSGGWMPPELAYGLNFKDYGSYGLRQYGGWVREEFLKNLVGQQAATTYREMRDNSSVVGSMLFAIQQAMRKVTWRVEAPGDGKGSQKEVEFADSLREDMSHTWEEFLIEALSMLPFGYSAHEIVYKKRLGVKPPIDPETKQPLPASKFNDGRIGWRRLPIRGQETVIKWFFDDNGQIQGLTQQPWVGTLIDIPIQKLLLFRPVQHKNNPEGLSVLRNAYRSYYFVKRLEELEAIMFERFSGLPVLYVPSTLLDAAQSPGNAAAAQSLQAYKKMVTNTRIDEQMGWILPSDTWKDADGKPSAVRMYELKLETPAGGKGAVDVDKTINRHKVDMLMTMLCDFIQMGHEVRGTNNLGTMKVDMFYQSITGWVDNITTVINRYALPRIWELNGLNPNLMPEYKPDMPQRMDLDGLGGFIANMAAAGMPLFPDDELQTYLRDAAGLPEVTDPAAVQQLMRTTAPKETLQKMFKAAMAKEIIKRRSSHEQPSQST